jgi:pimeloyl-ACP methyl ester carboxylesterase
MEKTIDRSPKRVPGSAHLGADIRGYSKLVVDATLGVTGIVENMHSNITRSGGPLGTPSLKPARGISGLVYRSIRGTTRLVGASLDKALAAFTPLLPRTNASGQREAIVSALNGVLGDHLVATKNPLALTMELRHDSHTLTMDKEALHAILPNSNGNILLMLHGLCMNDRQWRRNGHDHGAALAGEGFTPLYLRYNTGLHISTNGRALAELLESLVDAWPVAVDQIVLLGHSMGGLLSRSAHHYGVQAGHRWTQLVSKMFFLGSPHHGSPVERGGNQIDRVLGFSPYTAAFSRLSRIRSAGITDLRFGSITEEDWHSKDRFAHAAPPDNILPLPKDVACYAIAARLSHDGLEGEILNGGDGLVMIDSALGQHSNANRQLNIPATRKWIAYGTNHMDLLSSQATCQQLKRWLREE